MVNWYEYNVFGNTIESKEEVYNPFRYAGEQYDTATGQYYLRARFYNLVIARFTQEDVYRGDGLNLYAYVSNNPVKYVDPRGYKECKVDAVQGMESPVEVGRESRPYSHLEDSASVGSEKNFTAVQKKKIIEENMKKNGGIVKSDLSREELVKPSKSQKGVTPSGSEWQIDHIDPKDKGGSNSYSNAQVLSRKENRSKWNK